MPTCLTNLFIIILVLGQPADADSIQSMTSTSCTGHTMQEPHQALSLLQMKAENQNPRQRENLKNLKPLAWVHCPKCGTSFINMLLQHKGLCPYLPDDVIVGGDRASTIQKHKALCMFCDFLDPEDLRKKCPGTFSEAYYDHWDGRSRKETLQQLGAHTGIDQIYGEVAGHFITMLRQPEQRILSAWTSGWDLTRKGAYEGHDIQTAEDYAKKGQGCMVKMLVQGGTHHPNPCVLSNSVPPSAHEVELAKTRLRHGFAFVGITERWFLSICLFHKMFGGECKATDFGDVRPTASSASEYDTSVLNGWKDVHDRALYQEANAIFEENLQEYNVNQETCQACFAHAEVA